MIVFISHSDKDTGIYSALCEALDVKGITRWDMKSMEPGRSLAGQLQSAVALSDICVFLATLESINSIWCLTELGAFWGAGKRVIVYLADSSLRPEDVPPQFREHLHTSNIKNLTESIEKEFNRKQVTRSHPMGDDYRFLKYYLRGVKESQYRFLRDMKLNSSHEVKVRVNIMTPIRTVGDSDDILKISYCDYYHDFTPTERGDDWYSGEGKCGVAWQTGEQTLYAEDIDSKETALQKMHAASRTAKALKSVLSTPVIFDGKPIAILNIDSRQETEKTQLHKEYCSMMCREAAGEMAPVLANILKKQ